MEVKYIQAIKAGIIGGIIIGLLIIINSVITVVTSQDTSLDALSALNCCDSIVIIIVMAGIGALGVRMASTALRTLNEALLVAALAGAIAGIIGAVVEIITDIASSSLTGNAYYPGDLYGYSPSTISSLGIVSSICCCGPIVLVAAVILAIIGGAIYAFGVLKLK